MLDYYGPREVGPLLNPLEPICAFSMHDIESGYCQVQRWARRGRGQLAQNVHANEEGRTRLPLLDHVA